MKVVQLKKCSWHLDLSIQFKVSEGKPVTFLSLLEDLKLIVITKNCLPDQVRIKECSKNKFNICTNS